MNSDPHGQGGEQALKCPAMMGAHLKGKRHGPWVFRFANGDVYRGHYADGKMHGHWVFRDATGGVSEGSYVDGKPDGPWTLRTATGDVYEFPYVNGKLQGLGGLRTALGATAYGLYVSGKKHGPWVHREPDGEEMEFLFANGDVVGVKRHPIGDVPALKWVYKRFWTPSLKMALVDGVWTPTGLYTRYYFWVWHLLTRRSPLQALDLNSRSTNDDFLASFGVPPPHGRPESGIPDDLAG